MNLHFYTFISKKSKGRIKKNNNKREFCGEEIKKPLMRKTHQRKKI